MKFKFYYYKSFEKSIDNGTFKENLLPEEKEYIIKWTTHD